MFQSACEYYKEHREMPEEKAAGQITGRIYDKIKSLSIWVSYDDVYQVFLSKLPHYEAHIIENGIPAELLPKKKSRREEKRKQQQGLSELRQENEAAVHWTVALQMRYELEKGKGFFD